MAVTFSEGLLFKIYFFRRCTTTFPFHTSLPIYQLVIKWARYQYETGYVSSSCVSIIVQSCTIDKVYLSSRLQYALWNCYFLSKLLFQNLYFLKVLTYTLSKELLFQRMQIFKTAYFKQLTSWSSQILKYPGAVHRVMQYSENLSIKYHDQNFYIKTAFSGQHWTGQIGKCEKVSFRGNLIKISISEVWALNRLKNQQFKTCYSSLQYILLKMTIHLPLKWKISTRVVTLFWDPFWRQV